MNVKYRSDIGVGHGASWLPSEDDPADLFVRLYDELPGALERQRPDLRAELLTSGTRNDEPGQRIGELLDSWYQDPSVQRCAEATRRTTCLTSLDRREVIAAAPADVATAMFAVLLGLDRALSYVHPDQRTPSMAALSAVGLRYVRTGRLSTDRVSGALVPRRSPFDDLRGSVFARSFLSVERIPAQIWASVRVCRVPACVDVGRRAASEGLLLGLVPLVAREDLAISVLRTPAGEPVAFRLSPRDTSHLRERIREVLGLLDHSGVTIAVFPDHVLSSSLLAYWRELLRATPAPDGSALKWILIGGREDDEAPSVSRVLILDRDLGEVVLEQEKLLPSFLERRQLTLRGLEQPPTWPAEAYSAEALDDRAEGLLPEDVSLGARLNIMYGSLGWIAIMAGDYPPSLEPVIQHVTHLLRAGLASCAVLDRQRTEPSSAGGLVLSGGLLISELDAAAPLSGAAITLPGGAALADASLAEQQAESVAVFAFEPDEIAITSLVPGAKGGRLRVMAPASAVDGEALLTLRALQRTRVAGHAELIRSHAEELETLLSCFATTSESRQAAMALQLIARANADRGQLTAAQEAVDQILSITRRNGAQYLEAQARAIGCLLNGWSDQPLSDVAGFAAGELEWAEVHGYPHLGLTALGVLAQAHALLGQPGSAGDLIWRATQLGEELLLGPDSAELAAHDAVAAATVMMAAGDLPAAAAVLDRGDWALRRIAATRLRPGILALSARVRCHVGADRQAWDLLGACAGIAAADDVAVQAYVRGVRGLLLARQGHFLEAEQQARSAVKASDWSERLDIKAQARADLASVLVQADRGNEAVLPAVWALRLYERRGDVVSAAAIRETVPDRQAADDWPLRVEAWVMAAEPSLVAGHTSRIGVRLYNEMSRDARYPEARPDQPTEILVTVLAAGEAMVQPNARRLRLPRTGATEPLVFRITSRSPMPLHLHFLVNLYREGTLLKELGVTIPVLPPGPRFDLNGS